MDICQKCGDKGDLKRLVHCFQCHISVQHCYCLDVLPKNDEKVAWTCEECCPKDARHCLVPSRKSARIIRAADVRMNRMKMRKQINFLTDKERMHMGRLPEAKQLAGDFSPRNEDLKNLPSGNQSLGDQRYNRQKRRLVLEDGEISGEESKPVEVEPSKLAPAFCDGPLNTSSCLPSLETRKYVHARPFIDPIWRGFFRVGNVKNRTVVGLVAHLSSKARSKVSDTATALPPLLNVEILSRFDAWPKKFQISPPTDDSIALYFFPEYERDEKKFDGLLDDIIDGDLALKAVINNVDLLVFCSRELPPDHWRFNRKYYLWGVFRQRVQKDRNHAKTGSVCSPSSPLSSISSYISSDLRHFPFHPKALNSSDCVSSHFSKPDLEMQHGHHGNKAGRNDLS